MSDVSLVMSFKDKDYYPFILELDFPLSQEKLVNAFNEYVEEYGVYNESDQEFIYDLEISEVETVIRLITVQKV